MSSLQDAIDWSLTVDAFDEEPLSPRLLEIQRGFASAHRILLERLTTGAVDGVTAARAIRCLGFVDTVDFNLRVESLSLLLDLSKRDDLAVRSTAIRSLILSHDVASRINERSEQPLILPSREAVREAALTALNCGLEPLAEVCVRELLGLPIPFLLQGFT